jgi:hypothetical protein
MQKMLVFLGYIYDSPLSNITLAVVSHFFLAQLVIYDCPFKVMGLARLFDTDRIRSLADSFLPGLAIGL